MKQILWVSISVKKWYILVFSEAEHVHYTSFYIMSSWVKVHVLHLNLPWIKNFFCLFLLRPSRSKVFLLLLLVQNPDAYHWVFSNENSSYLCWNYWSNRTNREFFGTNHHHYIDRFAGLPSYYFVIHWSCYLHDSYLFPESEERIKFNRFTYKIITIKPWWVIIYINSCLYISTEVHN